MSMRKWRQMPIEALYYTRERLVRESDIWERRIRDLESGEIDKFLMQSVGEYKRRIKKCKAQIVLIDRALKERVL